MSQRWPVRENPGRSTSYKSRPPRSVPIHADVAPSVIRVESLPRVRLANEVPALNAQLRPHDAERIGGVVQVEALAPLAASERVSLMLADETVHGAHGRLVLDQVRLPGPLRAGIAKARARVLRGALARVRQLGRATDDARRAATARGRRGRTWNLLSARGEVRH